MMKGSKHLWPTWNQGIMFLLLYKFKERKYVDIIMMPIVYVLLRLKKRTHLLFDNVSIKRSGTNGIFLIMTVVIPVVKNI